MAGNAIAAELQPLNSALAGLSGTRREILIALKRRGEATVEDLARALGITVSAVRQHLNGLAASGFVTHRPVMGGPGRPRHLYQLSAGGEALFPKFYGELTNELLSYVEQEDPTALERIFERRRRRRVEGATARLAGRSFADQVSELARILDEDGYLADFEALPDGTYRITEHNCAILGVARRWGLACSTEIEFLREVLPEARVERVAHMMAGAHVCRYEITLRTPRPS
ncbi:MAG TPA: transcriptional regulator [Actinobacteria bacterium]|jgi:DeoR family suf operon transcriptional repressor|nr:transcriptional regulator [Actinomycetota bacterium]HCP60869.1 transcriptional regulator [Actinomycetota bacterium]